ncbi:hypothetical protein F5884DRAFT_341421 [Xylogone sp. PMI_703]|nr:hypothetical protein F5884DRAFT_341421 [Xylogone sp. PMI_703]
MPRRGFERVRTGCITCKVRRVKCDEARPICLRCKTTGRKCDGYIDPPGVSFSWEELLRIRPSSLPGIGAGSEELRSLGFFRQVAAPNLSGPVSSSFWTYFVNQAVVAEPAVRYAVLAISSLYETFDDSVLYEGDNPASHCVAIRHYNNAIRHITTSSNAQPETVILISALFVCIEFLLGNVEAAINHCRHGIHILNSSSSSSELSAVFRRLSVFPFFFGATLSNFPLLSSPACFADWLFETNSQAQESLDWLMSRTTRLVRAADPYRLGMISTSKYISSIARKQQRLSRQLDIWSSAFSRVKDKLTQNKILHRILEMQYLLCKIWVDICLDREETACDAHVGEFERIINIAREEADSRANPAIKPVKFIFNMGFSPLLHFVAIKCRQLHLRLNSLSLMKALSSSRESLWDAPVMYAIGMRIIEIEHGIELTPERVDVLLKEANGLGSSPAAGLRIRDSVLGEHRHVHTNYQNVKTIRRGICFIVPNPSGTGVQPMHDWICLQ